MHTQHAARSTQHSFSAYPRALDRALRYQAQWLWHGLFAPQVLIFVFGLTSLGLPPALSLWAALLLSLFAALVRRAYIDWRDRWEVYHAALDIRDSFDEQPSPLDTAKIELRLWDWVRRRMARLPLEQPAGQEEHYFQARARGEPPGPRCAIMNVHESAFWAEDLAGQAGLVFGLLTLLFLLAAVFGLWASNLFAEAAARQNVAQGAVSVVVLLLALDFFNIAQDFQQYQRKMALVAEKAQDLLDTHEAGYGRGQPQPLDERAARDLWRDYHLAHAVAPLAPHWVWLFRRGKLAEDYPAPKTTGELEQEHLP